jgi:DNA polymerase/3'-5' exonuclease PolX
VSTTSRPPATSHLPPVAEAPRFPLTLAREVAERLEARLVPFCERIQIAGSIRRKKTQVKDIELVLIPKLELVATGLFEEDADPCSAVKLELDRMLAAGECEQRFNSEGRLIGWGERRQALVYEGIPVDIFGVLPPAQWGVILMIRTGPADYSKAMVTQKSKGGKLPDDMFVRNGALWQDHHDGPVYMPRVLDTPEEDDFYRILGYRETPDPVVRF